MPNERNTIAIAALTAVVAGMLVVAHPTLIPALTVVVAVFAAMLVYLRL
ncbi:hypothetical protein OG840_59760 [Streptomyces sp. NBC_01764]|nr:hypothetical protein [Streptomyces sp. NBC_01764]MCX4411262.1 hypothetical protein [Streptomyces sp. NBC_01764]